MRVRLPALHADPAPRPQLCLRALHACSARPSCLGPLLHQQLLFGAVSLVPGTLHEVKSGVAAVLPGSPSPWGRSPARTGWRCREAHGSSATLPVRPEPVLRAGCFGHSTHSLCHVIHIMLKRELDLVHCRPPEGVGPAAQWRPQTGPLPTWVLGFHLQRKGCFKGKKR